MFIFTGSKTIRKASGFHQMPSVYNGGTERDQTVNLLNASDKKK
jgi:hypothetical protein